MVDGLPLAHKEIHLESMYEQFKASKEGELDAKLADQIAACMKEWYVSLFIITALYECLCVIVFKIAEISF